MKELEGEMRFVYDRNSGRFFGTWDCGRVNEEFSTDEEFKDFIRRQGAGNPPYTEEEIEKNVKALKHGLYRSFKIKY